MSRLIVVEVGLPQLQRLPPGQTIRPFSYESPTRFTSMSESDALVGVWEKPA